MSILILVLKFSNVSFMGWVRLGFFPSGDSLGWPRICYVDQAGLQHVEFIDLSLPPEC